jgi:hypothetical protein
MTVLKRVAATCATSSAQKTWTMAAAAEEGKFAVQNADRVTTIPTRPLADLERASQPIVKPMTGNVQVVGSPCHRDPHSPARPELAGRRYS